MQAGGQGFDSPRLHNFDPLPCDYSYTHRLDGTKHLGLWPLAEAAETCFGIAGPEGLLVGLVSTPWLSE